MSWQQLIIYVNGEKAEPIADYLTESGALSVTFMDDLDEPIFEPALNTMPVWRRTRVIALFPANQVLNELIIQAEKITGESQLKSKIELVEDKDWIREWMDNFKPIQFAENLWVCPSWLDKPDPTAVNIMLDPGLAFGTGTHATTALCLQWLGECVANYKQGFSQLKILDFGCGSGILGIAATLLGCKNVIATDIDPQAIQASLENAKKNAVSSHFECLLSEQFYQRHEHLQVDILMANILASPLVDLAEQLTGFIKPGGIIVLSGILKEQQDLIEQAYQANFEITSIKQQDEWIRIVGHKCSR